MMLFKTRFVSLVTLLVCGLAASTRAGDWPQFRGPGGLGVSTETGLTSSWDDKNGVVWKTTLPGAGSSSPIVVGDRVFVTCFSDPSSERMARHLVCVDSKSGKIQWDKSLPSEGNEDSYTGFLREHGYASSTPASDGKNVYVFYGHAGVLAYDFTGKKLWQADVGNGRDARGWGSAASPILYKDKVILNAGTEGDAIIALNKLTGKEEWRAKAENARGSWGTPVLVDLPDGKQELVLGVPFEIWGLNPDNGKLRWYAEVLNAQAMCTSIVAHDGIVYAIGGRSGAAAAIKAGGSGDVGRTNVLWQASIGSYVTSPIYHDGHLFWVSDRGVAVCLNAKSGEVVYEKRVDGAGGLYASVTAADGKLYAVTRRNGTFVLSDKPEFNVISHNDLRDESDFNASPAVSNGKLFLRSNRALYCIGGK